MPLLKSKISVRWDMRAKTRSQIQQLCLSTSRSMSVSSSPREINNIWPTDITLLICDQIKALERLKNTL